MKRYASSLLLAAGLSSSCQLQTYAPPPHAAQVESVEVEVREFHGRPEAYATVKGHLTTSAAQLVDAKQSREGHRLYLEILEQTPRGASLVADLAEAPSFQRCIPIELLGLEPGTYILSANGIETTFDVPSMRAETLSSRGLPSQEVHPVELVDEFIPLEESPYYDPAEAEPTS